MATTRRRILALVAAGALVLSGCSSDKDKEAGPATGASGAPATSGATFVRDCTKVEPKGDSPLNKVEVQDAGEAPPTLKFEEGLAITKDLVTRVVCEGKGEKAVADGDLVFLASRLVDTKTGKELQATTTPQMTQVSEKDAVSLVGMKTGSQVLVGQKQDNGTSYLQVVQILDAVELVSHLKADAPGLPQVDFDENEVPAITVPKDFKTPSNIQAVVLKEGDGRKIASTDELTVHYTGWTPNGVAFDSSWLRSEPSTFPLTGVVTGWTYGLTGQKVGSTVLLVFPPAFGYGGQNSPLANDTLIFVVKILEAKAAPAPAATPTAATSAPESASPSK